MKTYVNPQYAYLRHADQANDPAGEAAHHPVIVIGAGPVGLCTAIDLALHGTPVVVLDDDQTVSVGSRAVCYAKRSLEILDRLGCGEAVAERGISWNRGRVFLRDREVYGFDLLPEPGHERPAFVNLQQYHFEENLVARAAQLPGLQLRWANRVTGVEPAQSHVRVTIETPDGPYTLHCAWLVVCDGARSPVRHLLGLESHGQVFRDRFLIADVVMKADYPTERWFWFDPPFHPGQSVLLHRQADHVWRVDFQLGWDADPELEKQPERVMARLKAMLGDREFELEWVSVYTFQCRRIDRFRHGRVLFAGDAAHQVSPFGARGANSGIQDADALAWRLAALVAGQAQESVLDHWAHERERAADENILNSTRSTDFITPKSTMAHAFREATLQLAGDMPFARRLVNSGRLSTPSVIDSSPANTPSSPGSPATQDASLSSARTHVPGGPAFSAPAARPGAPSPDAPLRTPAGEPVWWLRCLSGDFAVLMFADHATQQHITAQVAQLRTLAHAQGLPAPQVHVIVPSGGAMFAAAGKHDDAVHQLTDQEGLLTARLDARPGTVYLLRPDQHVCARWRTWDAPAVLAALARALGQAPAFLDRHAA